MEEQDVRRNSWKQKKELKAQQLQEAKQIIEEVENHEILCTSSAADNSSEIQEQAEAKCKERAQVQEQRLQEWQTWVCMQV